jgi:hypothetical protein
MFNRNKERPVRTKEDWDRFMRERQRAEYAIADKEFLSSGGKVIRSGDR